MYIYNFIQSGQTLVSSCLFISITTNAQTMIFCIIVNSYFFCFIKFLVLYSCHFSDNLCTLNPALNTYSIVDLSLFLCTVNRHRFQ